MVEQVGRDEYFNDSWLTQLSSYGVGRNTAFLIKWKKYLLLFVVGGQWKLMLLTARHTQLTNTFRTFIGEQIKIEEEIRFQNMQNIR